VCLNAARIDIKQKRMPLVPKRVEGELDVVIGIEWCGWLAPGQTSANTYALIVPAAHDDVEISVVVSHVAFGPLRRRLSIRRLVLNEICNLLQLCSRAI